MRRGNVHKLYPHRSNRRHEVRHAEEMHTMHRRHQRERADQAHAHMNERADLMARHEDEASRMADRQTAELGGDPAPETMPPTAAQGMTSGAPSPMGGGGPAFGRG
jgi:hypothetical protein